jgi:hypothetical protein
MAHASGSKKADRWASGTLRRVKEKGPVRPRGYRPPAKTNLLRPSRLHLTSVFAGQQGVKPWMVQSQSGYRYPTGQWVYLRKMLHGCEHE